MNRLPQGYKLTGEQKKGYNGPIPTADLPASAASPISPWYLLPHQTRAITHEQTFRVSADVVQTDSGWTIHLTGEEPQDIMMQLSFVFGDEGELTYEDGTVTSDGSVLWKSGKLRYSCGDDWLELDGGEMSHLAATVREAKMPENCKVVLVNFMTPFDKNPDHTISVPC